MPALPSDLRSLLERTVTKARSVAEDAARQALTRLSVADSRSAKYLTATEQALRATLRARAKQLGDAREADGSQAIGRLTHDVAYEHWHRMLFARFLAENGLLRHNQYGNPVTLEDCRELAEAEAAERPSQTAAPIDRWHIAERFAVAMLPQIFRPDDPVLAVELAPEARQELEGLLEALPALCFTADDALGWVYQFWQSAEKQRVNDAVKAGAKIDGQTLPAVTQLFTEHYMVLFLLHNTLGAWHAAKVLADPRRQAAAAACTTEAQVRELVGLPGYTFDYLRFVPDEAGGAGWRPAAGGFPGWPRAAKDLKVLDPCCGSGHFLVAAFDLLARLRMAEEACEPEAAAAAVLADNLYGLELDPRCTQIAAFNVAMAAWRLVAQQRPGAEVRLGELHIACSGQGPNCTLAQWLKLADTRMSMSRSSASPTHGLLPAVGREAIRNTLRDLYELFSKAPELGSLIDPTGTAGNLGSADWETVKPFLADVLAEEGQSRGKAGEDAEGYERAVAALGLAKAAEILAGGEGGGGYTLVITNVPYLGRGGQGPLLKAFAEATYPEAKADLATVFVQRMLKWVGADGEETSAGTIAAVTPQNWLFLTSYKKLRERLLKERTWNMVARLGPGAFETIGGHVVNVALVTLSGGVPTKQPAHVMAGVDASGAKSPADKAALLRGEAVVGANAPSTADDHGAEDGPLGSAGAASAPLQPDGTPLQPDGTPLQPTGTTLHADGSGPRAAGSGLRTARRPVPTAGTGLLPTGSPADAAQGAPASGPGSPATTAAGMQTADSYSEPSEAAHQEISSEADENSADPVASADAASVADGAIKLVPQAEQLKTPDARVILDTSSAARVPAIGLIAEFGKGSVSGDGPHYLRRFWEVIGLPNGYRWWQNSNNSGHMWAGRENCVLWEVPGHGIEDEFGVRIHGQRVWERSGVAITKMSNMIPTLYAGGLFDDNLAVLSPNDAANLPAFWVFCESAGFLTELRALDAKLSVTAGTFPKVPFDLAHWQKVAAEKYPNGLPEPQSDDPTQWLFHGHPAGRVPLTTSPTAHHATVLHVAMARLLGYRWPAELDEKMRLAPEARALVNRCAAFAHFADDDGVIPLHATTREHSAHDRLNQLVAAAYADLGQTPPEMLGLIRATGSKATTLAQWLREDFATGHNALFHHRPFIWHITDGRKDGFAVLVHYHRLAAGNGAGRQLLSKIAFTYLGDYISDAAAAMKRGDATAEARRAAAVELQEQLKAILSGEPPYDLFVRWKPLAEQPIGWEPDINDGVRVNIRPFVRAGVLKGKLNVKWEKDRGKEPQSLRPKAEFPWFWSFPGDADAPPTDFGGGATFDGVRWNDVHYTTGAKEAARKRAAEMPKADAADTPAAGSGPARAETKKGRGKGRAGSGGQMSLRDSRDGGQGR